MSKEVHDWKTHADWFLIPDYMRKQLASYVDQGTQPGDFLGCVLSNDLRGAFHHADFANIRRIRDFLMFLDAHVPAICWGSKPEFEEWMRIGGLTGFRTLQQEAA